MSFTLKENIMINGEECELEIVDMSGGEITGIKLDGRHFIEDNNVKPRGDELLKSRSVELFKMADDSLKSGEPEKQQATKMEKRQYIHNKSWTDREDQILIDNRDMRLQDIYARGLLTGRTKSAIANRINRLIKAKMMKKKIGGATKNLNFNRKVLETKKVAIYEQCFNHLLFKVRDMKTFSGEDVVKILKDWYANAKQVDLAKSESSLGDYQNDYILYGLEHGFIRRIEFNAYQRIKKKKGRPEKYPESIKNFINENYHRIPTKDIAKFCKIKPKTVRDIAKKLGLADDPRGGDQSNAEPVPDYIKCNKCNSKKIKRDGTRKNKNEAVQRYRCENCGFRFTGEEDDKTTSDEKSKQMKRQLGFETVQPGAVAVKKECVDHVLKNLGERTIFSDDELLSNIRLWYKNNMDREISGKIEAVYLNEYKNYLFKQSKLYKVTHNTSTFKDAEKQKATLLRKFVAHINKKGLNRVGRAITIHELKSDFIDGQIKQIFSSLIQQNNALQTEDGIKLMHVLAI